MSLVGNYQMGFSEKAVLSQIQELKVRYKTKDTLFNSSKNQSCNIPFSKIIKQSIFCLSM